ncbi:hypothetical protein MKX08_001051 [Trichoderma sp. CBMAI-0020]|nr:hypothetical protein MKX08_001051 [Trichoderma sp. CBMAI-0020]
MMLLRRGLLRARLVLCVPLDASIGIKATDSAVGLGEDLAALFNQRLHLPHQRLFVKLLLGRPLGRVDLVGDHLADGPHLVERLLDASGQLAGQDAIVLGLFALLDVLLRLLGDVLKQSDVSDGIALVVDHIAVFINLLAGAGGNVAADELGDEVSFFVQDVALAVDLAACVGGLLPLFGLGLFPALSLAQDVSVAVDNVSVLVDLAAKQLLGVALGESSDDIARRRDNCAILCDGAARELGKGALFHALAFALANKLGLANDVARLAQDVAVLVTHAAHERLDIALDDSAVDGAGSVDDITSLINPLASQRRHVDLSLGLGLGLVPSLGLANHIASSVEDVTIFVDLGALEMLRVAVHDDAHLLSLKHDSAISLHDGVGEVLKGGKLLFVATLRVVQWTAFADLLARVVPDVSLAVGLHADELLGVAFKENAEDISVLVDQFASLVDLASLEVRVINWLLFFQLFSLFGNVRLLFFQVLGVWLGHLTVFGFLRLSFQVLGISLRLLASFLRLVFHGNGFLLLQLLLPLVTTLALELLALVTGLDRIVPAAGLLGTLLARSSGVFTLIAFFILLVSLVALVAFFVTQFLGVDVGLGKNLSRRVKNVSRSHDGVAHKIRGFSGLGNVSDRLARSIKNVSCVGHNTSSRSRDGPQHFNCHK